MAFKFDKQKFVAILNEYSEIVEKSIPDCVALNARLLCVELARRTQPFGTKPDAGVKRVELDIGKIIKTDQALDDMVAEVSTEKIRNRLQTLVKQKRYDVIKIVLERIGFLKKWGELEVTSDFKTIHQEHRKPRDGRTRNRGNKLYIAEGNLPAYIEDAAKRVGIAKSGWARCAEQLPQVIGGKMTRGIPDWVADQTRATGEIENHLGDISNPRVLMTNTVPWVDRICPASEQLKASQVVIAKMKKQMETILKKRNKTLTE
jgi:nucleoid DNA-binding protein